MRNVYLTAAAVLVMPLMMTAAPVVGVAKATGQFTLNSVEVRDNATLFEGNTFDSGKSEVDLTIRGGAGVHLAASARGAVYHDRVLLSAGGADFHAANAFHVDALSLQVVPTSSQAVSRLLVDGSTLTVGALKGEVNVLDRNGVLLAKIEEGKANNFTQDQDSSGTPAPSKKKKKAAAGAATGAAAAGSAAAISTTTVVIAGVAVAAAGSAAAISAATSSTSSSTLSPSSH